MKMQDILLQVSKANVQIAYQLEVTIQVTNQWIRYAGPSNMTLIQFMKQISLC